MAEGEDSRVFGFDADGANYVARINPAAGGFRKDQLAFERFASPALPVPEVVLIEPFVTGWLCVSRRAPGDTLQALSSDSAYAYGAAIGRVMDAMATISPAPGAGAGPILADGTGRYPSWPDYIAAIAHLDWSGLTSTDLTSVGALVQMVMKGASRLPDTRLLVHGDFGSNNVVVADGAVTGVIDWSEASIGDPLYDLANLMLWRPWLDCMEQQCRYFALHEAWRVEDGERLACYQLHIGLKVLHDALRDGDDNLAKWALARCAAISENVSAPARVR